MAVSIMDLHTAEEAPSVTAEIEATLGEVHSETAVEEATLEEALSELVVEEATVVEVHSAVALPVAAEVPLGEAIAAGAARAAVTVAEAVFSAEVVRMRTSAFIIRWTSRIGHFA